MHLKKVTKTVDYYSYGLSSDARSRCSEGRRPQLAALGSRSPRAVPGAGPTRKGRAPKGLAHLPTQSREGGRGRGRGGPRDLRAKASGLGQARHNLPTPGSV